MRGLVLRASAALVFIVAVFASSGVACTKSNTDPPNESASSSGRPEEEASSSGTSSGSSGTSSGSSGTSSGSTGTPPPPESYVDVTLETFDFGGKERSYYLAKPKSYDANKSYPLVLSFHGNPGTAISMVTGLAFDSVSQGNAVIAYPQGDANNWDLYTPTDDNADMYFIEALPDEIATKANIDKSKIFGFGYSGGGFFLTQFTCRFGNVFKAISVNAGGGPDEEQMGYDQFENGCYMCPGGPVAALITHGDADGAVEPESGEFTHLCYSTFNGCDETLSPTTPAPCQLHDNCPAGKPVKWCLLPGQSHAPWADAMKEAWAFFIALP